MDVGVATESSSRRRRGPGADHGGSLPHAALLHASARRNPRQGEREPVVPFLTGPAERDRPVTEPPKLPGLRPRATLCRVNVAELEAELLKLDAADRARLAEKLLESLETLSERENQQIWLDEASRRDADLDANPSHARSAELRDARARFG